MARKKINQSDLRRLMKERSETVTNEEKVESPLAKYDKFGKLSCIACSEEVKIPWRHHILSRKHKENINKKLKRKNQDADDVRGDASKSKFQVIEAEPNTVNGRSFSQSSNESPKVASVISEHNQPVAEQSSNLITGYSSSSSDEEEEEEKKDDNQNDDKDESSKLNVIPNALPPGFFDAQPSTSATSPAASSSSILPQSHHLPETEKMDTTNSKTSSEPEGIPEGFFDDPILDAKARKVEYKDPMEEEWEKFQKTMAEEANVSQNIMEEDLEKSEVEKDIDQIDQMIFNWKKVNNLQSKKDHIKEQLHSKQMEVDNDENADSSVEDEDLEYLLDWRATGASKK